MSGVEVRRCEPVLVLQSSRAVYLATPYLNTPFLLHVKTFVLNFESKPSDQFLLPAVAPGGLGDACEFPLVLGLLSISFSHSEELLVYFVIKRLA